MRLAGFLKEGGHEGALNYLAREQGAAAWPASKVLEWFDECEKRDPETNPMDSPATTPGATPEPVAT